jgi:hypothetical protein
VATISGKVRSRRSRKCDLQFVSPITFTGIRPPVSGARQKLRSFANTGSCLFDVQREWNDADFTWKTYSGAQLKGRSRTSQFPKSLSVTGLCHNGYGKRPPLNRTMWIDGQLIDFLSTTGLIALRTKGINSRPLKQIEDGRKTTLKYANNPSFPLPIIVYGFSGTDEPGHRNKRRAILSKTQIKITFRKSLKNLIILFVSLRLVVILVTWPIAKKDAHSKEPYWKSSDQITKICLPKSDGGKRWNSVRDDNGFVTADKKIPGRSKLVRSKITGITTYTRKRGILEKRSLEIMKVTDSLGTRFQRKRNERRQIMFWQGELFCQGGKSYVRWPTTIRFTD